MLISNTECLNFSKPSDLSRIRQDVRIEHGIIRETGVLSRRPGEKVIDAEGGSLLPGLHDHHVHLASYAASLTSVSCGPTSVCSETGLIRSLQSAPGNDWLRGINYHESVAGHIDRKWLDDHGPDRPIRIQHRSGRLWILNTVALELLEQRSANTPGIESDALQDVEDGRLFDLDNLLREITKGNPLPVARASQNLASFGVTGINDMTPSNDLDTWQWFIKLQTTGDLLQKLRLSGKQILSEVSASVSSKLRIGELKVHLHESELPDFFEIVESITISHSIGRAVAIHCVTQTELIFALAAIREAGILPGDRIEHASVMSPDALAMVRETGVYVVTQPNFILDRGDSYLSDIPPDQLGWLYRCRSLAEQSVPFVFGTDLPFGSPDPWIAIKAATCRQTNSKQTLAEDETITPEMAMVCFLGDLDYPLKPRSVAVGAPADLCLLDCPWTIARKELSSSHVRMTILDGEVISDCSPTLRRSPEGEFVMSDAATQLHTN